MVPTLLNLMMEEEWIRVVTSAVGMIIVWIMISTKKNLECFNYDSQTIYQKISNHPKVCVYFKPHAQNSLISRFHQLRNRVVAL